LAVETPAPSARSMAASRQESNPEEIQLLSRARQADSRRDYAEVLSVLSEHERNFPGGRLSEEREVLRVKALVGLGRTEQARRTAARFRRQFPKSVLLHKVDEMLASKP
jgi:outer membrane protein assembly factor BamD (BamD/ComL family)